MFQGQGKFGQIEFHIFLREHYLKEGENKKVNIYEINGFFLTVWFIVSGPKNDFFLDDVNVQRNGK